MFVQPSGPVTMLWSTPLESLVYPRVYDQDLNPPKLITNSNFTNKYPVGNFQSILVLNSAPPLLYLIVNKCVTCGLDFKTRNLFGFIQDKVFICTVNTIES